MRVSTNDYFQFCFSKVEKMSSESYSGIEIPKKRRKGVVNSETYKCNVIKTTQVQGKDYVNYKSKIVLLKNLGEI